MASRTARPLPAAPPPSVMEEFRRRLPRREVQALEALFALRATTQQMDNAVTEWLDDSAGSPARFQILILLAAAGGKAIPHKDIVAALGVTRATVSGLMAGLERDGLVTSTVGPDDLRTLVATLTPAGEAVIKKAKETNAPRLRAAFASLSPSELTSLLTLLHRVREGFAASTTAAQAKPRARRPRVG